MAQLTSTTITGNLAVTGDVVASSIKIPGGLLTNGNGDLAFASGSGWSSLSIGKTSKNGILTIYKDNTFLDIQIDGTLSSKSTLKIPAPNSTNAVLATQAWVTDKGYTTNTGDVKGPSSATDTAVALFSGTGGKTIKNSGVTIDANNNVKATSYSATSDARLKENLRPVQTTQSILSLPIYKFDFIAGQKDQIGCLAQDLKIICPELVDEDQNGYLSIKESKIVYLLLEEIKKLKSRIDFLERKESLTDGGN